VKRLAVVASLFVAQNAFAAGLSRPNVDGARAIGLGGAYAAVADDPTAVWHNPASPAFFGDNMVYLGGELLITQRSYTPSTDSQLGQLGISGKLNENTGPTFLPLIGFTSRFGFGKTKATRFALSLLVHLGYGGKIGYDSSKISTTPMTGGMPVQHGLQSVQILDYEITPALSYQVTDAISIGAGLRIGVNAFSADDAEAIANPTFHISTSNTGVGIGGSFGIMIKPHKMIDLAAVYRTPLSATMTGSGPLTITGQQAVNRTSSISITWPQSAALGMAIKPHWRVLLSLQADWTAWSSVQTLVLDLTSAGIANSAANIKQQRFMDSWSFHLGLQTIITKWMLIRAGYAADLNAIPDATVRRENQDANKGTLGVGLGFRPHRRIAIDAAFETLLPLGPTTRTVKQNADNTNEGGSYSAQVFSVELAGTVYF
jgi:long-chain fatty acid transport protein